MGTTINETTMGVDARGERRQVPLRQSLERFLKVKARVEAARGRALTYDEAMTEILELVDLERLDGKVWLHDALMRLSHEARHRLHEDEADLIEQFAGLVRDVIHGKVTYVQAEDALLSAGGGA